MATVLVSFIGTGKEKRSEDSRSRYETVSYDFSEFGDGTHRTSIFSVALLKFLKPKEIVDKWLILGSSFSIWCDLLDMFDNSDDLYEDSTKKITQEKTIKQFFEFLKDEATKTKTDSPSLLQNSEIESDLTLNKWENFLNDEIKTTKTEFLRGTEILCRLVGYAADSDSHNKIFKEILDVVENGDKIVFDVTHGLRNQPIITGFVIMYLRYLKNITDVEFYYGAKDLDGKVIKLDFCNELLKATEAVAIFEQTGNYEQIGNNLLPQINVTEDIETITFSEEMLRPKPKVARKIKKTLFDNKSTFQNEYLKSSLADRLTDSLEWSNEDIFANRLKEKALKEFKYKQYFKSVATLWEAVLIAGCKKFSLNPQSKEDRNSSESKLYSLFRHKPEFNVLKNLEHLRNGVLHGSESQNFEVRKAMSEPKEFAIIFNKGVLLIDEILK